MNSQTRLLEELCQEGKSMNKNGDRFWTHSTRLENIAGDVAAISIAVQGVEDKSDVISSGVSCLMVRVDEIRLVFIKLWDLLRSERT